MKKNKWLIRELLATIGIQRDEIASWNRSSGRDSALLESERNKNNKARNDLRESETVVAELKDEISDLRRVNERLSVGSNLLCDLDSDIKRNLRQIVIGPQSETSVMVTWKGPDLDETYVGDTVVDALAKALSIDSEGM